MYRVQEGNEYLEVKTVNAGVPEWNFLEPLLSLLYESNKLKTKVIIEASFADDTFMIGTASDYVIAMQKLQNMKSLMGAQKWKIKINESISIHVIFRKEKISNPPSKQNYGKHHNNGIRKYSEIIRDEV